MQRNEKEQALRLLDGANGWLKVENKAYSQAEGRHGTLEGGGSSRPGCRDCLAHLEVPTSVQALQHKATDRHLPTISHSTDAIRFVDSAAN